jgi:starch phosphorylase
MKSSISEADAQARGNVRTGLTADEIKQAFRDNLVCGMGRLEATATKHDLYMALALTVRDRVLQRTVTSMERYGGADARRVAYLSAEFLLGPHLANNMLNLGMIDAAREAMSALGHDLEEILAQEEEPGLGNGGLGRLAACYMDSLSSVEVPALGYGIRYEFGIFDQAIRDGWQLEITDKWLKNGNPWEIAQSEITFGVKFGGRTEASTDEQGRYRVRWTPQTEVRGVAYDTPITGYRVATCNVLRLWKAEAIESFDFEAFNQSDYDRAVEDKVDSETITKVLYPNDEAHRGKELRLKQQYFFSSCSLQDMLRIHKLLGGTPSTFHEKWAVQLNDTHPAVAVAELMRLLIDEHAFGWDEAWAVTRATFAYTNHTLLPEALEKWAIDLFGALLPRHLEIVFEINRRFLEDVRAAFPGDEERLARLSIIDESGTSLRPHGKPRERRQPQDQRRRRTALGASEANRAARFRGAVAG